MSFRCLEPVRVLSIALAALAATGVAQSPAAGADSPVIRFTSQTVQVDVVVMDHSGHAVQGLKKEDFKMLEDGKPQAVSYFEVHAGAQLQVAAAPKLPPGMYSNFPAEIKSDAVDVILLDSLNTPTQDQITVRKEMISYLKAVPPGTRIAIFTLASHLRMVNGFTTDPAVLLHALTKPGAIEGVDISPLLITQQERDDQEKSQDRLLSTGNLSDPNVPPEQKQAVLAGINQMRQFVSDEASFNDDMRVKLTLQAMDALGRYLGPLPGRKNLIWFSASFPIGVNPDFNQTDAYRMMRDYSLDLKATARRLAAARVAVYPIDARRFFRDPANDASSGGASSQRNGNYRTNDADRAFDEVTNEHDTMDSLAEDTGGHAIYNTGDLKRALAEVIDNGDRYYTLAYDPVNVQQDGKFHKITVKLDQPGYELLYRHGYIAGDAKAAGAQRKQPDKDQTTQASAFRTAMAPGGPPASEILFRMQTMAEEQQPGAADKLKGDNPNVKFPVTRYVFGYMVDVGAANLTTTPDGFRHGLLLAMVIAYDQLGRPTNSVLNTEKLDLDPKVYADALKQGLPFYQELDIPPGDATIRVGVYDAASQKMGATEFPLTVAPQNGPTQPPKK